MRLTAYSLLTCLLLAATPSAHAQTAPADAPAPPPADAAALRRAEAVGQRLFRLDRAAWVASDTLMAAARGQVDPRVQGWITDEREDGIDVIYVDTTPAALYRVSVDAQGQPTGLETRPAPLTPAQAAAARAVATAQATAPSACTGYYNPVVIPGEDAASWIVYLLPGSTAETVVPLGGAWRITVRDGQPGAQRAFTNSCITLDNRRQDGAFVVSHLLDPTPTEIHVFWSLWADKPMFVTTSRGTWAIRDGQIVEVPPSPTTTPTALDGTATMTHSP